MIEWKVVTLDQVTNIKSGKRLPKGHKLVQKNTMLPYIRLVDVTDGIIKKDNLKFLESETQNSISRYIVNEGDVCLAIVGHTIGMVFQIDSFFHGANLTENAARVTDFDNQILSKFLYYQLISPIGQQEIISRKVGSAQGKLPLYNIRSLPINLPPLPEQKAIAHILGTLDDKIELNRKMNQTLEAMAQALFKSWFVDFDPVMDNALAAGNDIPEELQAMAEKRALVPHSKKLISKSPDLAKEFPSSFVYNETLGKWIPEGWEVKSFGDLIETTIGGDWGKEVPDEKHTEEVKIIRGTDIPSLKNCDLGSTPTRFVELKKLKTRKLEVGDIVIEVSGGSPTQSTGRSIRLTENILERLGGIAEPASFCRRLKPINEKFGVLCGEHLTFIYGLGKMWEYQNQSTGIANFQTPYFLEAEMVLVPSEDKVLDSFYSQVLNLKNKATLNENIILTQLRDTLLPELISGRVRVPLDTK
ncbi:restriction endonuclease subunit S [Cyclobacterium sp. 1_MG-2023]|uniref:restriction endonuclease subunit S n=1 Tax=Cyclobacterium sp. 1_MG-2023 TaxID=3062681 RepID=UPI0026E19D2E|nr:restriction endonuclease subunit S [Cyclobacterium sp. 1_MG-2023]MDO6436083.1 restriction endonuclease subunit S [Cyclobacterium sp. 1_MG-2023]